MKFITDLITKMMKKKIFLPKPIPIKKPLGRWIVEDCSKKIDLKIDLSNEDHCGPCGQYSVSNKKEELPYYRNTDKK